MLTETDWLLVIYSSCQGVAAEIGRASIMRVSKFFFFPVICDKAFGKKSTECNALQKACAGALATFPEIIAISPAEVAKVGLQLDHTNKFNNNTTAFIKHMYKTRGLSGVYCGWAGMQYRQCAWTGTYFATLSGWRDQFKRAGVSDSVGTLLGGFCAGVTGVCINCPGDVVRTVVQQRVFSDPARPVHGVGLRSVAEHVACAREMVAERGLRALYAGFGVKCFHLGGSGALMAFFIPKFRDLLGVDYDGV